ncbi:cyanophycinase [Gemmatimonas sp.]|jgi:cyanophycinase|uniref:cyanophycinase n=1 Tax=Gemmatimonas sp. TaxID=1962908 RepID=UPI0037BFC3E4
MRQRIAVLLLLAPWAVACGNRTRAVPPATTEPSIASVVDTQPGLTTYVSGSTVDVQTKPLGGVLLAGGGTDSPDAMRWLMGQGGVQSNGAFGDVVVLRASGADGYHRMLMDLGANSVTSFVVTAIDAANRDVVRRAIARAEVVFIAGGDQSRYVKLWTGTALQAAVNARVADGYPIGGTSAGLAVLSSFVYAAFNVSSTSAKVLLSPYDSSVTITSHLFDVPGLSNLITDSHFVVRDRMGRLVTFLARLQQDGSAVAPRGIGIDEKSAVGVTKAGTATVFGGGNGAYLLSAPGNATRVCAASTPLTFTPVSVVRVPVGGAFNMSTWTSTASVPYTLHVNVGVLSSSTGAVY